MHVVHYLTENGIDIFQDWLDSLRDMKAKVAVLRRIDRLRSGNPGDHKACREGVAELRCDVGPGYRVYYFIHGNMVVVLLCGGDKSSQRHDIARAVACKKDFMRRMALEMEDIAHE